MIKFIATADVVFGIHVPIRIIFAAPVCKPTPYARIDYIVENIIKPCAAKRPALGGLPTNIEIELCCNDKFSNDVYIPLKNHLAVLNNDNELFLRALNMAKAAEEALMPPKTGAAGKKTSGSKSIHSKTGKRASPRARKTTGSYSYDQKLLAAVYYLKEKNATLGDVQAAELGISKKQSNGSTAKKILNELGIDTSRASKHKGLLLNTNIDDAINDAAKDGNDILKTTLEEIKKRKLHLKATP